MAKKERTVLMAMADMTGARTRYIVAANEWRKRALKVKKGRA